MAAEGHIGLAVTGTHGKSTTTALLGHLLEVAGLDPTVEVGAFIPAWGAIGPAGRRRPIRRRGGRVRRQLPELPPRGAIVTNVEMDHPDFFADREAVLASMERFVRGMRRRAHRPRPILLAAAGGPWRRRAPRAPRDWEGDVTRYGPGGTVRPQRRYDGGGRRSRWVGQPFDALWLGRTTC